LNFAGTPRASCAGSGGENGADPVNDPFLNVARRAKPSPKGKTRHADIDRILYGRH